MSAPSGHGAIAVARVGAATIVERAAAHSPLKLVATRNHGDAAWIFAATFGGGLVDGDRLAIDVAIGEGASLFLGTQASTKVYRSPAGCGQRLDVAVGAGGLLVMLPDPIVCFAGARYAQEIEVRLGAGASLVLIDGFTCGRAARGERWELERYASRIVVRAGDTTLVHDAVELDPAHGALPSRLGRFDAMATVLALGPRAAPIVEALRASAVKPTRHADLLAAVSPVGDGALVRLAGVSIERVGQAVRERLAGVAGLLGDDPFARKW